MRHKKPARVNKRILLGVIALICGAITLTMPFILMSTHGASDTRMVNEHTQAALTMSKKTQQDTLNRAHEYNEKLAQQEQKTLGQVRDPFTNTDKVSADKEYNSQLNRPDDGIMASITYPKLNINLPVYHGTSDSTLLKGAGHLYGTSLPVGGDSTHAVISAHSGLADRTMFDRLNGLGGKAKLGDIFYVTTLGETLAYKVNDIQVVTPTQFGVLKIKPGHDLVTLLTCTPYGVNTQRLLVTGERVSVPLQAPPVDKAPRGQFTTITLVLCALIWVLAISVITITVIRRKKVKKVVEA